MRIEKIEGRDVRFWDFTPGPDGKPKGSVKQPVEVEVQIPETLDEALAVANQDQARLLELVAKGLTQEAEEKSGATPAGTFSQSMISAADKALKVSPQFAGIKSSKDRKIAIMTWISTTPGLKDAYLLAFEPLRATRDGSEADED